MLLRPDYREVIRPVIDTPIVKILTGIRRCGKSTIFIMLHDKLLERGVHEDNIISDGIPIRRFTG